jgi:hypothetical protein
MVNHTQTQSDFVARYIHVHETTETLKDQMKQLTKEAKTMKDEIHETLVNIENHRMQISEHLVLELKTKKRIPGMNNALIGEAYVTFQEKHGRSNIPDVEREEFLLFIKEMRKMRTEMIQEVQCSPL